MKILKITLIILLLTAVVISGISCKAKSGTGTTTSSDVVAVQRGNLEINITATGNLAYTDKEDLTFDIGGTVAGNPITVDQVLVNEGDVVKKGQVLAKLDDSAWQDYLETLGNAITTAQRNQTTKERALTSAQRLIDTKESALATAQRQVTTKELDLRQAEVNLQMAEYNLNQIAEVKKAKDEVDDAKYNLKIIKAIISDNIIATGTWILWTTQLQEAITRLANAERELNDVLAKNSLKVTTDVALQISQKQLDVDKAQKAADDAQVAINDANTAVQTAQYALDDANIAVDDAKTAVDDAKKSVADAQETLDEAMDKSTEIIAPFDGFITAVNATGGLEVNKGFVAFQLADPNKFESNNIVVGETDISKVKLDGDATVSVDSLGGLAFPAKVTFVAPTATVQSGVVNFKVTVELTSLTPILAQATSTSQTSGQARQGTLSGQTRQGSAATGQTSQGAVPGQIPAQFQQGTSAQQTPRISITSTQSVQLREGLTVTVNIAVAKSENVLMVPNKAITTEGGQTYVQVISSDGKTEKRAITKGISNWQYTEVTQGLSDGEQVIVTKSTTTSSTTSTSSSQQRPPQPMFIPGVGR